MKYLRLTRNATCARMRNNGSGQKSQIRISSAQSTARQK